MYIIGKKSPLRYINKKGCITDNAVRFSIIIILGLGLYDAQTQTLIIMIHNQEAIQAALDAKSMKAYGKLTVLLNHAHQVGLINTKQLKELDANLEQLRLGNNSIGIKAILE
jgi:hypothetical protein